MLPDHFFRQESGRLISALTRMFGLHNLSLAEDVTQEVLCRALETWKFHGLPDDPHAWLVTAARRRALDVLRGERSHLGFAPELGLLLDTEWMLAPTVEELFEPQAIVDSQLRMMFSCCHAELGEDAQVALILQVLCGFGVAEVAAAFLVREDAMEKRLTRAKRKLASGTDLFDFVKDDVASRLSAVQRSLYLLFNEGYHGAHAERAVRDELCAEGMRCVQLLLDHPGTDVSSTQALAALMSFLVARLGSRLDSEAQLVRLQDQDRTTWRADLIAQGAAMLDVALRSGGWTSVYHFEAAIAGVHATCKRYEDTPWEHIVTLYDGLLRLRPSPVVELNRAVAWGCWKGPEQGLLELEKIREREVLQRYPFYAAALGELELQRGQHETAAGHFARALGLARNPSERKQLQARLEDTRRIC